MTLFPLMTTWIWVQILTASPLPSSERLVEDAAYDARFSLLSAPSQGGRT
jgi:hypothetical protein